MSESPNARRRPRRGRPEPTRPPTAGRAQPARARLVAVRVLDRVERVRAFADLSLHHHLSQANLSAADRRLATELVYGTLRWRGRIDFMLDRVLERGIEKVEPQVASTLRLGAYQILFTDRIRVATAVDESVKCIRALGLERGTSLVNAVLRKLGRMHADIELPSLEHEPLAHLTHALSIPGWIAERWLSEYGSESAAELARASNRPPPLTVRANRGRVSREALLSEIRERFPDAAACEYAPDGIVLARKGDPARDPAFVAGHFTVQDEAAQIVVEMLDPQPRDLVLDVCSAPGTKSTGIAERLGEGGGVLALDRHPRRLGLVARAARRLGLENIHTLERDCSRSLADLPTAWVAALRDEAPAQVRFDRALADVPCTGLGTLRRNPDARWRLAPSASRDLANLQLSILRNAANVLRPGGCVVYSTCTLLPEENDEVVQAFLRASPEFRITPRERLPAAVRPLVDDAGLLRLFPHLHDTDGFFAARFEHAP